MLRKLPSPISPMPWAQLLKETDVKQVKSFCFFAGHLSFCFRQQTIE
jgi:hypothetical protein